MTIEVKVPQLPESVSNAQLTAWHKSPGDLVERDENLADLETDKVVLELPAPARGILREIQVQDGTTVTPGQLLATLEPEAEGAAAAAPASGGNGAERGRPAATPAAAGPAEPASPRAGAKAGPAARRLAKEQGVNLDEVRGSGRGGRVLKEDLLREGGPERTAASANAAPAPAPAPSKPKPAPATARPAAPAGERGERRVPMSRLRARIAERMVEAQHTAAMLTTFNEIDMGEVMALRVRYRDTFEKRHGVRLGFMGFFVKGVIEALKRFPVVNASVEDNEIVYHDYYDVGIAVSTDRGLIVPVVRDADQLGFAEVEAVINDYGRKAREGGITMDDLTGGTFTITNGGVFGSLLSTPILNPPQSGILGMHKIQERPVVVDGEVAVRPMMYVALTYDHRIIDGREAVQFLVALKESLEDPARLLLGV